MQLGLYTLVGFRGDGASPAVDVVPAADRDQALTIARSFLTEHGSCSEVEIYYGGELVAKATREVGAADA